MRSLQEYSKGHYSVKTESTFLGRWMDRQTQTDNSMT